MAFRDFTFPKVLTDLKLKLRQADLYPAVPPAAIEPDFATLIADGIDAATGTPTEKGRSEFIIAPVLLRVRRLTGKAFNIHSGETFDVDAPRGLNGVCDFLLSRSPITAVITAPLAAVVEAKSDDVRTGYGQCIAAMVAARDFNQTGGEPVEVIHGVSTTGIAWRFLQLRGDELAIDLREYLVADLAKLVGILCSLFRPAPAE